MGHRDRLADLPDPRLTRPRRTARLPQPPGCGTTNQGEVTSLSTTSPPLTTPASSTSASRAAPASATVPSTTATIAPPRRTTLPAPEPKQVRNRGATRALLLATCGSGRRAYRPRVWSFNEGALLFSHRGYDQLVDSEPISGLAFVWREISRLRSDRPCISRREQQSGRPGLRRPRVLVVRGWSSPWTWAPSYRSVVHFARGAGRQRPLLHRGRALDQSANSADRLLQADQRIANRALSPGARRRRVLASPRVA